MSLPLKNDPAETTDRLPREDVGPKLVAMESYDPDIDVADAAAEEVEAVLLRPPNLCLGQSHSMRLPKA